jgi:hypothetical protein
MQFIQLVSTVIAITEYGVECDDVLQKQFILLQQQFVESYEVYSSIQQHDSDILALAAKGKCPGAASWVPDFSKNL